MNADEVADRLELRKLVDSYAAFVDQGEAKRFAELFLPDGRIASRDPDGTERVIADGTEELRTNPSVFHQPPRFKATMHLVGSHVCEIDGDRATGLTYCAAHHLEGEGAELEDLIVHLWYEDIYVRTENGWRFASRVGRPGWTTVQAAALGRDGRIVSGGDREQSA